MNNRLLLVLSTVASLAASGAIAQQNQGGSTAGQMQQTADLPEACRTAVQASAQGDMMQKMQGMQGNMSQTMPNGMQSMAT